MDAANDNSEFTFGVLPGGFDSLMALEDVEIVCRWPAESESHFRERVRAEAERRATC